jgi:hypothetical protein
MCRAINHDTGGIRSDQGSCFDTYRHNVSAYRSLNPMKSQVRLLQRELRYIVVFETRVREGFIFINVHNKNEVGQMQFFLSSGQCHFAPTNYPFDQNRASNYQFDTVCPLPSVRPVMSDGQLLTCMSSAVYPIFIPKMPSGTVD